MDTDGYRDALHREDARAAAAAELARERHGWAAPVPACPGWTLADLVWHLAEVQHFWTWVVGTRAPHPGSYAAPARPGDDELVDALRERSAQLEQVLAAVDPADRVWTWAPRQDAGFVLRRQVHEAVVHRVDVEQVAGAVTAVDPPVGLDGLDEWLEVMVPGALPAGPPPDAAPVVFAATDADAERTLFDSADLPVATLTGTAGDLLLVAWRRLPVTGVVVHGDADRAAALIGAVRLD